MSAWQAAQHGGPHLLPLTRASEHIKVLSKSSLLQPPRQLGSNRAAHPRAPSSSSSSLARARRAKCCVVARAPFLPCGTLPVLLLLELMGHLLLLLLEQHWVIAAPAVTGCWVVSLARCSSCLLAL